MKKSIWKKRNILGVTTLAATPLDNVVCSVAPGNPSYFWAGSHNIDNDTTPAWYTSAAAARSGKGTPYYMTHCFNMELAIQVGALLLLVFFRTPSMGVI